MIHSRAEFLSNPVNFHIRRRDDSKLFWSKIDSFPESAQKTGVIVWKTAFEYVAFTIESSRLFIEVPEISQFMRYRWFPAAVLA
jgi:hypothetical protein